MPISFIGSGVGTHAATSAQTYNFSSLLNAAGGTPTLAQGDIVVVAVVNSTAAVNRGAGALVPSGYTAAHTALFNTDTNASNYQVSYKFMGATPDTSVSIPASNATTSGIAYAVYVFRGVSATTPMDATPTTAGAGNTGVANAPAITPVTQGAWIVACGGAAVAAGAVFTNPAGMSTTTNHFRSTTITTTTNDANVGVALLTTWTSGAYDPAAFGGSTTTNTGSWSAVTLALRPIVNHGTTGVLTATLGSIAGSAVHNAPHSTTGTLAGQGGVIVGSAARTSSFVDHATTGTLTGQGSTVAGSSARFRAFASSGALTGQGAAIAGSASNFTPHSTSGALTGQGSAVAGTAARFRAFASSGALTGAGALLDGAAERTGAPIAHDTSGALVGGGPSIEGSAQNGTPALSEEIQPIHAVASRAFDIPSRSQLASLAKRQRVALGILPAPVKQQVKRIIRSIGKADPAEIRQQFDAMPLQQRFEALPAFQSALEFWMGVELSRQRARQEIAAIQQREQEITKILAEIERLSIIQQEEDDVAFMMMQIIAAE